MDQRKTNHVLSGGLISILLSLILLIGYYHKTLLNPNTHVFASPSDGIKNYYAVLYHARYDDSPVEFGGMNYPYGNHISYVDAQPILSWFIGVSGLTPYGTGIMNLLMLLSFPVTAWLIYRLMIYYRVSPYWASLASVAIAFMTPQVFRILGHYSLAYPFVIPLGWYLQLKCDNDKGFTWPVLFGLYVLMLGWVHPYLATMIAGLSAGVLLFRFFLDYRKSRKHGVVMRAIIQVILPLALLNVLVKFTDAHPNRTHQPDGFFEYHANAASVFLPSQSTSVFYVYDWIKREDQSWEGESYIGTATIIFILLVLIVMIRQRKLRWQRIRDHELFPFLVSSLLLLILSFCFPFRLPSFQWMLPYLGALKQLRSLGRFSWVFYYVITIISVVLLYRVFIRSRHRKMLLAVFLIGMSLFFYESYAYHRHVSTSITRHSNIFEPQQLDVAQRSILEAIRRYQPDALMLLPFNHYSSGCFDMLGSDSAFFDGIIFSYHTGVPLMNSSSSRASLTESENFIELFSPPFLPKNILADMGVEKNIMILRNRELMRKGEEELIREAAWLGHNGNYDCYLLRAGNFRYQEHLQRILDKEVHAHIEMTGGWRTNDTVSGNWVYYDAFEKQPEEYAFTGKGSWQGIRADFQKWKTFHSSALPKGRLVISFWVNIMQKTCKNVNTVVEFVDDESNTIKWLAIDGSTAPRQIEGEWGLIELEFDVPDQPGIINIFLDSVKDPIKRKMPLWLDDLLIRPAGLEVFRKVELGGKEHISYNNYILTCSLPDGENTN